MMIPGTKSSLGRIDKVRRWRVVYRCTHHQSTKNLQAFKQNPDMQTDNRVKYKIYAKTSSSIIFHDYLYEQIPLVDKIVEKFTQSLCQSIAKNQNTKFPSHWLRNRWSRFKKHEISRYWGDEESVAEPDKVIPMELWRTHYCHVQKQCCSTSQRGQKPNHGT